MRWSRNGVEALFDGSVSLRLPTRFLVMKLEPRRAKASAGSSP